MKAWEDATSETRAKYLTKEEEDRRRFMTEDEITSRHCATLTARARSPRKDGEDRDDDDDDDDEDDSGEDTEDNSGGEGSKKESPKGESPAKKIKFDDASEGMGK